MVSKTLSYLNGDKPLIALLIFASLVGLIIGFDNANWQVSVETGQVIAGLVKYPPANPTYMYHVKLFTIITQLSALMLYITNSEIVTSYLVTCLLGVVVMQGLSVLIYAFNRDAPLAIVGAIFIYYMEYTGSGVVYSISLLGGIHTYGLLGLFFILLTISLFGARAFRYALFCLGLAPAVHPSLGCWLYLLVFITAIINYGFSKEILRKYYPYFIAGFALALVSLAYQMHLMKILPAFDSAIKKEIFYNYIKYWDAHRVRFFYNEITDKYVFFHPGFIFAILSSVTALIGRRFFKDNPALVFICTFFLVAGPLSLIFGLFTHVPPEKLPVYLVSFMPGRFINLSSLVLYPVLIGIATYIVKSRGERNLAFFTLILLLWYFFMPNTGSLRFYVFTGSSLCFIIGFTYITLSDSSVFLNRIGAFVSSNLIFKIRHLILVPLLLVFLYAVGKDITVDKKVLIDWTNMPFLTRIHERPGYFLATSDFDIIALRTRRPVLFVINNIDGLAMVPESSVSVNNVLKGIYGVDLLSTLPPRELRHMGVIDNKFYRRLWQGRSLGEWQKIRDEFGVSDILTLSDWRLNLPVVARIDTAILYTIPPATLNK